MIFNRKAIETYCTYWYDTVRYTERSHLCPKPALIPIHQMLRLLSVAVVLSSTWAFHILTPPQNPQLRPVMSLEKWEGDLIPGLDASALAPMKSKVDEAHIPWKLPKPMQVAERKARTTRSDMMSIDEFLESLDK